MFTSPHLIYCNCVSVPLLHYSGAYSPWNCPVSTPASGHRTSIDGLATHGALTSEGENSEPSASRRLKFGIENILYGAPSQPGRWIANQQRLIIIKLVHSASCYLCRESVAVSLTFVQRVTQTNESYIHRMEFLNDSRPISFKLLTDQHGLLSKYLLFKWDCTGNH